jgi:hypothetical protein
MSTKKKYKRKSKNNKYISESTLKSLKKISLKDLIILAKKYNVTYKNKSAKKIAEFLSMRWRYMSIKDKTMISHLLPHKWFQDIINKEPIKMPKAVKDIEYPIMNKRGGGRKKKSANKTKKRCKKCRCQPCLCKKQIHCYQISCNTKKKKKKKNE